MSEYEDLPFIERVAAPLRAREAPEPTFEARLLAAIQAAAARGEGPSSRRTRGRARDRGVRRWLTARRQLAVSPLIGLAAAAGFAALVAGTTLALTGGSRRAATADAVAAAPATGTAARNIVHFAIAAPAAHDVRLVGDFNGWDRTVTPLTRGAVGGLWIVTVPLPEGSYHYAFVIDGTAWAADPAAPVTLEDEFGAPSSLITVRGGST